MSLINDALKRARNKVQGANAPASDPAAPMQPVEQRRPVGLPVYFMPLLLFVIAGACYFLIKGWDAKRQAGFYPQPVTIQARELEPLKPESVAEKEYSIPSNRNFSLNDTSPSPAAKPKAAAASADVSEEPQSSFKLQGIFYKATDPSAVINSKTVYVGDTIGSAKVKAIGRQSVTLVQGGETKVLTLQ